MSIKVEIFGKFYCNHSFSVINRNLALELSKNENLDVYISPVDRFDSKYNLDVEQLKQLDELFKKREHLKEPIDILLLHTYPPIWRWPIHDTTKIICYQHWEYPRIPFEWQYKWETYADAMVCSSNWTKENILNAGINPNKVYCVNPGYDEKIFNTEDTISNLLDTNKFVFTYVGCAQFRKGADLLLEAWVSSFAKADNAVLFIKDNPYVYGNSGLMNEIVNLQYKHSCADIIYNDDMLSNEELAAVYKNTDVIVHPYRGEGFGMPVQEAMACGAFPLVTNGGALNDFVNNECGLLINSSTRMVDLSSNEIFAIKPGDSLTNMGDHGWVLEPQKEDLINKMKSLYFQHNNEYMKNMVSNAKLTTWNKSSSDFAEVITEVFNNEQTPNRVRR